MNKASLWHHIGGYLAGLQQVKDRDRDANDHLPNSEALERLASEEAVVDALGKPVSKSPSFRAIWDLRFPFEYFGSSAKTWGSAGAVYERQLLARDLVMQAESLHQRGELYSNGGVISPEAERRMAHLGYFGFMIPSDFGGKGASMLEAGMLIETMAKKVCPSLAGLLSIHSCIGAVDPLVTFGLEDRDRTCSLLSKLASGELLSGFALTEPGAGSAIDRITTTGTFDGEDIVIHGEKLWISNSRHSGLLAIVLLIDGLPEVVLAELPAQNTPECTIIHSGTRALPHVQNNRLVFKGFRVPAANLVSIRSHGVRLRGKGRSVAYHGLNKGRVALAFNASGVMSRLLGEVCAQWVHQRRVFGGGLLKDQQLVRAQLADAAARVIGVHALAKWSARLLDEGHSIELEGILAKRFASADQWTMAIEDIVLTWGGRGLMQGNSVADSIYDLLVPRIYEGENRVLCLKWLLTILKPAFSSPLSLALWYIKRIFTLPWSLVITRKAFQEMPEPLRSHARSAASQLQFYSLTVPVALLLLGGKKAAGKQLYLSQVSEAIQNQIARLVIASEGGAEFDDESVRLAAELRCIQLSGLINRRGILRIRFHRRLSHLIDRLGKLVANNQFPLARNVPKKLIPADYEEKN